MEKEDKNYGRAYAFFYYRGKMDDILDELPRAQKTAKTSKELGIEATGLDDLDTSGDSALTKIVKDAKSKKMTHVLKATLPNAGNRKTAEELYQVMGNIYNSPLYGPNDPLLGGISYKRGDEYVFLRR